MLSGIIEKVTFISYVVDTIQHKLGIQVPKIWGGGRRVNHIQPFYVGPGVNFLETFGHNLGLGASHRFI